MPGAKRANEVQRAGDRHFTLWKAEDGTEENREMTEAEYGALALPGAGPPAMPADLPSGHAWTWVYSYGQPAFATMTKDLAPGEYANDGRQVFYRALDETLHIGNLGECEWTVSQRGKVTFITADGESIIIDGMGV